MDVTFVCLRLSFFLLDENIEEFRDLIRSDTQLSISGITQTIGVYNKYIGKILDSNFTTTEICTKLAPQLFHH